jgi:AhpD family alkylhydroperoxidase
MFTVHTHDTAPDTAKPLLDAAKSKFGMVPNLLATFAGAPAVLEGYLTLAGIFDKTSFSPLERQVVLMTSNYENTCHYCMAAHTTIADMQKLDRAVINAIRDGKPIADSKLEALRRLTASIITTRGYPNQEVVDAFLSAGYTKTQVMEVIMGVALKVMSNYTNHINNTPLDGAFTANAWTKKDGRAA